MNQINQLIDQYYLIQEHRIAFGNQIFQLKEAKESTTTLDKHFEALHGIEKEVAKDLLHVFRKTEMHDWLKAVKGIGPVLGCALMFKLDPAKADHASSFWKYCGLAPDQKRTKGEKLDFNPFMKKTCFLIGESFVKSKGRYRGIYDTSKEFYQHKFPEPMEVLDEKGKKKLSKSGEPIKKYTKMHIHRMAVRRTVKLFLSHFWAEWRKRRGLPVSEPFAHRGLENHNTQENHASGVNQ